MRTAGGLRRKKQGIGFTLLHQSVGDVVLITVVSFANCRVLTLLRITMASKAFKVQKVMVQPINLIFRFLQQKDRVAIWLYENTKMRIEGIIIGFDEYMNVVLDQAEEHYVKTKTKRAIGKILLKGDNITLIHSLSKAASMEEKYG